MSDKKKREENTIPEDELPNPVSIDNDLHIKDQVYDEESHSENEKHHESEDSE